MIGLNDFDTVVKEEDLFEYLTKCFVSDLITKISNATNLNFVKGVFEHIIEDEKYISITFKGRGEFEHNKMKLNAIVQESSLAAEVGIVVEDIKDNIKSEVDNFIKVINAKADTPTINIILKSKVMMKLATYFSTP